MKAQATISILGALVAMLAIGFAHGDPTSASGSATQRAAERARLATQLFERLMSRPATALPASLLESARAVAVFPELAQDDLPHRGDGLLVRRLPSGEWSAPIFVALSGMQRTAASDVLLVFQSDQRLGELVEGRLELGADANVAAGPLGSQQRSEGAHPDAILGYVCNEDVFAGMALDDIAIRIDAAANQLLYGRAFDAQSALTESSQPVPEQLQDFLVALDTRPGS